MKIRIAIVALLLTTSGVFAGEPPDSDVGELVVPYREPVSPSEFPRLIASSQNMVVPVPAKTPFDASRGDRRAYLRAYRAGYRFTAATGWSCTCCLLAGTRHGAAIIAGHYDGQSAAPQPK